MSVSDRISFSIKAQTGSDNPILLHPGFDYTEKDNTTKKFNRTQGGQLNAYTLVSSWQSFELPLDYVSSEHASTITDWWRQKTLVHYSINATSAFILDDAVFGLLDQSYNPLTAVGAGAVKMSLTCRITNETEPFPIHVNDRFSNFSGLINLVTV